jgi:hypothetical protein
MSKDFLKIISGLKSGRLEFVVSHSFRDEYPFRKASSCQSGKEYQPESKDREEFHT